jgi:NitT/TauT family transport system permease protein
MTGRTGRLATVVLSLAALLMLWQLAALGADPTLLPSPVAVAGVITREAKSGALFYNTLATLLRVAASFVVAMAFGSAIGIALGLSGRANRIFDSWLIVFLNIPALVIIVLCYIWLGLNEVAAIAAVAINKIPNVVVTMREGTRAVDPLLDDMARVFRLDWKKRLRHVILPQLQPFVAAASRTGLSLIWKIVLIVELLGRPNGVGFQIHLYFQLFDVAAILAYTVTFVVVMIFIELVIMQPLERRATRWRKSND